MDNKAQGALEYLLLIGGAVLVAAIVIALLASIATDQSGATDDARTSIDGSNTALGDLLP